MNTGIQRSAATPLNAVTTTTPRGKPEPKKDIMAIVAAHNIPYAATASPHLWKDPANKVRKAMSIEGPTFLHVLAPCPRGWRYDPKHTIKIAKLAVETRIFPIYEIENGKYRLNYVTARPSPIEEYLATQERYAHLLKPENRHLLEEFKKMVEERWQKLLELSKVQPPS
jgi:pyruvate ferredoxin oxidoreductase beta subunit